MLCIVEYDLNVIFRRRKLAHFFGLENIFTWSDLLGRRISLGQEFLWVENFLTNDKVDGFSMALWLSKLSFS